ncbi:ClbS/DfsB family four-helix bundle protein [Clostridium paraputrificum]|uniref:ClbS/DfsB family four-helix bundle protein n=1 Tax=Clostridium paraputrificum TaxID=29363 RepID=UPI003D34790F
MQEYENKLALINEINKRAELFIDEFKGISNEYKDKLVEGVDRTPAQMIAYQLGWISLILNWEKKEQEGDTVVTPSPDYRWNNLGGLYENFYEEYEGYTLSELINHFQNKVKEIISFVDSLSDEELFLPSGRKWSSSTPSNWPIWKWIHINTVAPFKSFRTKIRKWKKLQ